MTKEQADAEVGRFAKDAFSDLPNSEEHQKRVDKPWFPDLADKTTTMLVDSGVTKTKFRYVDTEWDREHAAKIELLENVTKLPKIDYRRDVRFS